FPGDEPGNADAERVVRAKLAGEVGQRAHDVVAAMRRGPSLLQDDLAALVQHDSQELGAADIDASGSGHDSERTFNSRTVLRIRCSARRLTKPGSGTTSSIARS